MKPYYVESVSPWFEDRDPGHFSERGFIQSPSWQLPLPPVAQIEILFTAAKSPAYLCVFQVRGPERRIVAPVMKLA